jgi:hypothetical protein
LRIPGAVTPVALLIAAAGTAAYAYFVDRGRVSDADREARRRDAFPSFRPEDVSRVELAHGAEVMVLERDKGDGGARAWTMRSPRAGATDTAAVDTLVRELEMAPRLREVREEVHEGGALGLDAPRVRGRVTVGPLEYRFELGADAPRPEGAAYMRIDGEGSFVVGRSLKVQLLRDADTYREHTLVPYGVSDVARLEVRGAAAGFVLARKDSSFRVGGPGGLRASRAATDRLFGALADARADSFVDDAEADRAAAAPAHTVTISPSGDAPSVTLLVGGPCPKDPQDVLAVRTEPARLGACVAKRVADALSVAQVTLVDQAPFFAHADEIEEVRLESAVAGPEAPVDIARRGTGWHERSPEDRDLVSDEVDSANALTLALASAQGGGARPPEAGESFGARWRATVFRTGGSAPEVVEVGAADRERASMLRRTDDGAILRVDRAVARRLRPNRVFLRSLAQARVPVDPGAVVAIEDSCTPALERLELAGGTWKARVPTVFDVDPVAVTDLLGALSRARADAWIAEADDGTFGFEPPSGCAVMLTVAGDPEAGEPRQVGVVFGAAADSGDRDVNAHLTSDPEVFVAPKVLRELASHPVIARDRFRVDLAALSRVTFVRGAARLALVRASGADRLARAGAAPSDADDDKLQAALAALYAQSALHLGPPAPGEGLDHPILAIDLVPELGGRAAAETRLTFGAPVHESAVDGYFARASGVDATFLVPRHLVDAILGAW